MEQSVELSVINFNDDAPPERDGAVLAQLFFLVIKVTWIVAIAILVNSGPQVRGVFVLVVTSLLGKQAVDFHGESTSFACGTIQW
jgi:hypothetical protein